MTRIQITVEEDTSVKSTWRWKATAITLEPSRQETLGVAQCSSHEAALSGLLNLMLEKQPTKRRTI